MAKKPLTDKRFAEHEELKITSGWYLAAWRDFRGLTGQELADEVGSSRGTVYDLETGQPKKDGSKPVRFNRDWVDLMAKALNTTGGRLIDVNPFKVDSDALELFAGVSDDDRSRLVKMITALKGGGGGES